VNPIRKHPVVALFLSIHLAGCSAFLFLREPGISFPEEEERMRRDSGYFFVSSAGPIMHIAGRPLYNWSEWHGGEARWVKILEVANLPALIATVTIGHVPIAIYRSTGRGTFLHDTWIRALVFLLFSVAQWVFIGRLLERIGAKQMAAV
jgi:hypothetical protein